MRAQPLHQAAKARREPERQQLLWMRQEQGKLEIRGNLAVEERQGHGPPGAKVSWMPRANPPVLGGGFFDPWPYPLKVARTLHSKPSGVETESRLITELGFEGSGVHCQPWDCHQLMTAGSLRGW